MARVFVLGSGFSAALGLPTLRELFHAIMEHDGNDDDKKWVLIMLEHLYPHFQRSHTPPAYPPFEEFLSLVMAAEDLPQYSSQHHWPRDVRKSALRVLTDSLGSKSAAAETEELLHKFVGRLQDGDVVVTFNWDTLMERELLRTRRRVEFKGRDSAAITVLKLRVFSFPSG